jgi:hypothetical protein
MEENKTNWFELIDHNLDRSFDLDNDIFDYVPSSKRSYCL